MDLATAELFALSAASWDLFKVFPPMNLESHVQLPLMLHLGALHSHTVAIARYEKAPWYHQILSRAQEDMRWCGGLPGLAEGNCFGHQTRAVQTPADVLLYHTGRLSFMQMTGSSVLV